ncbi:MAG: Alpha-L-glutamate ligase-related protein [Candidatus Moranbacteria bacterium GW2011_GWE2_35_2-]|nr:MAG: Alpha-L-glutamate ligase-related protein [Candidatus Moranbacteria bacterium GW2011_GWE2_35_2-]KKQ05509.1 MAG: Alpha-L-glutamate ligase-related protein [Candidatus Moranbacteria bacterium GW2011_GWF1_36_4]KKQ22639.1 MAG: Alpha-L-glutamate ligase-related protein [Candidatus Moranbacteria bacterium GW2011_GWF2_37_11]KKQ29041.1 MAG: Alpha-L-glutamate ligase-related protein [Candidatus Moranbacteria bacterium GW2011_GWD1_37_17]KKQ30423.1 MAG: Alpha-L-glutamate ligase-related protein [Candid
MFRFIKNSRKILGMNSRNLKYIRPNNRKKAIRLADDKILSKRVLKKGGIPVPDLLAKISSHKELDNFDWSKLPSGFALKPNRGLGGEGILVVYGRKKGWDDAWVKADGSIITIEDIKNHIRNILDGNFSISGEGDIAFFEERLRLLKLFKTYAYKGIPDIRVIVFNKVPVMAMLRLPTKESGGKANLQQGGIGLGIDLATGVTTTAVQGKSKIVEYVPGTRLLLSGIKIPYWKDILELAVKAQEISGLGFLGADVAIDKEKGPVFVEINARAGLSIQIANLAGLRGRLERVEGLKIKTIKRGVRVGMDLFGGEIEEELEEISGRRVIGTVEKVKLIGKNGKEVEVEAKIDTGAMSTSIDVELARELGFEEALNYFEKIEFPQNFSREDAAKIEKELRKKYLTGHSDLDNINIVYSSHGVSIRPAIKINFIMDSLIIPASVNVIKREELKFQAIIGKRNLGRFLVDVNK